MTSELSALCLPWFLSRPLAAIVAAVIPSKKLAPAET
jgi:hypothetical protein